MVRASAIAALVRERPAEPGPPTDGGPPPPEPPREVETGPEQSPPKDEPSSPPRRISITVTGVPADKARDVVKVAVMPLASEGSSVEVTFSIEAIGGASGISRNTIDLVVREGLRQLGLDVVVREDPAID